MKYSDLVPQINLELVEYDMLTVMKIQRGLFSFWYNRFIKRFPDILISVFVIVVILSWLTPILSVVDLLASGEGVFFV